MFRPVGYHQVLLRLGDCCTYFSLLVALKILKFYINEMCHLLRIVYFFVSHVLALLPLCVLCVGELHVTRYKQEETV
jgi:hypothetical protein